MGRIGMVAIGPDAAGLDRAAKSIGVGAVTGPDAGAKAIERVVGDRQRIVLVLEFRHRNHGSENLLLSLHAGRDDGPARPDQRRKSDPKMSRNWPDHGCQARRQARSSAPRRNEKLDREDTMTRLNRRAFVAAAAGAIAAPYLSRNALADDAIKLRCSLDTAPSHPRNQAIVDYLAKIEEASQGKIKGEVFHSGQLFADLNVAKALIQGQVDMAAPGTWTMTGLIPDVDFCQLPALYSPAIDVFRRCADGAPGESVNKQVEGKVRSHVLGNWLELGNENWYTTKKEIHSLEDLNGL